MPRLLLTDVWAKKTKDSYHTWQAVARRSNMRNLCRTEKAVYKAEEAAQEMQKRFPTSCSATTSSISFRRLRIS